MIDPGTLLVVARALLFAAAGQLAGALYFDFSIAPLARRRRFIVWGGWGIAVLAASLWLVTQAAGFGHRPLGDVIGSGVLGITVTRTRFGHIMMIELALAVSTALALGAAAMLRQPFGRIGILPAAAMLATLAWIGHGGDDHGLEGGLHVGADAIHLLAMGAWLGGLLPLALMIRTAHRIGDVEAVTAARRATWRFSSRCLWAVGALAVTGCVNAWLLVGSFHALVTTDYGQLLLVKIGIFLPMFGLAAINREILIPRLSGQIPGEALDRAVQTFRPIYRNTILIAVLGIIVLSVVAKLGRLPPALHDMSQMQSDLLQTRL
jgi:putative copper resistance protein D